MGVWACALLVKALGWNCGPVGGDARARGRGGRRHRRQRSKRVPGGGACLGVAGDAIRSHLEVGKGAGMAVG